MAIYCHFNKRQLESLCDTKIAMQTGCKIKQIGNEILKFVWFYAWLVPLLFCIANLSGWVAQVQLYYKDSSCLTPDLESCRVGVFFGWLSFSTFVFTRAGALVYKLLGILRTIESVPDSPD